MIMRPWLVFGSVLALCLWLGACAQENDVPPPVTPPPPPVVSAPAEKPPEPPAKPHRRPPPPKPAKTQPASPEELIGLDEGGVRKLLGAPAETRTDGAARILAYRAASCGLDVIFFMDVKAGDLRVVSYQWDDNGGTRPQVAKGCYAEFRVPQ